MIVIDLEVLKHATHTVRQAMHHELHQGSQRLTWVTTLSEPFCRFVENLHIPLIHITFETDGEEHWHIFAYTEEEKEDRIAFSLLKSSTHEYAYLPKPNFTAEENRLIQLVFEQIPWHTLLEEERTQ